MMKELMMNELKEKLTRAQLIMTKENEQLNKCEFIIYTLETIKQGYITYGNVPTPIEVDGKFVFTYFELQDLLRKINMSYQEIENFACQGYSKKFDILIGRTTYTENDRKKLQARLKRVSANDLNIAWIPRRR